MAVILHPNALTFNMAMQAMANSLPEDLVKPFVQKIAIEVLSRLVMKTPVDTGRARGNWQVTEGTPAEGWFDTSDRTGSAAIGDGVVIIESVSNAYPHFWITNNVPYIERLDQGWSDQAPTGMLENTINELGVMFS